MSSRTLGWMLVLCAGLCGGRAIAETPDESSFLFLVASRPELGMAIHERDSRPLEVGLDTLASGLGLGLTRLRRDRPLFDVALVATPPPVTRAMLSGRLYFWPGSSDKIAIGLELEAGLRVQWPSEATSSSVECDMYLEGAVDAPCPSSQPASLSGSSTPALGLQGGLRVGLSLFLAPFAEVRLDPVGIVGGGFVGSGSPIGFIAYAPSWALVLRI